MDRPDTKPGTRIGMTLRNHLRSQLGEIVLLTLLVTAFVLFVLPLAGANLLYKQGVVWTANILMMLYIWAGVRIRGEDCSSLGLGFKRPTLKQGIRMFLLSLLVFVLAMVGFMIASIIMVNITGMPEQADMSSYDFLKDNLGLLILTLTGVYIASSFGEEVIYRGFLINRISEIGGNKKMAVILAVFLSAVIFGLVHYEWGAMGVVQTFFMGLVLGICYLKLKKRLWILILAHGYMDTILMLQLYWAAH